MLLERLRRLNLRLQLHRRRLEVKTHAEVVEQLKAIPQPSSGELAREMARIGREGPGLDSHRRERRGETSLAEDGVRRPLSANAPRRNHQRRRAGSLGVALRRTRPRDVTRPSSEQRKVHVVREAVPEEPRRRGAHRRPLRLLQEGMQQRQEREVRRRHHRRVGVSRGGGVPRGGSVLSREPTKEHREDPILRLEIAGGGGGGSEGFIPLHVRVEALIPQRRTGITRRRGRRRRRRRRRGGSTRLHERARGGIRGKVLLSHARRVRLRPRGRRRRQRAQQRRVERHRANHSLTQRGATRTTGRLRSWPAGIRRASVRRELGLGRRASRPKHGPGGKERG